MKTGKTSSAAKGTIQSAEQAIDILKVMADVKGPLTLSEIAQAIGMPAAKAHRYLSSLINTGIVTQTHRSGAYDLGDFSIRLGLAALSRQNQINRAADAMEELVQVTQTTALLTAWGPLGPTIIRWERSENFVVTALGLGTTFPLLTSATGMIFTAYLPQNVTRALVAKEREHAKRVGSKNQIPGTAKELRAQIKMVASRGFATVDGRLIPGLAALAAPILNIQGEIEASLSLIGTNSGQLKPNGPAFNKLIEICRKLSQPQL